MIRTRYMLTAAALLSSFALFAAEELSSEANEMIRNADLNRQEIIHRGDNLVREGHRLFELKEYFAARDKFMEAVKLFRRYPSKFFQDKIEFCQKEIAACYYAKATEAGELADKMAFASNFDEAIKICKEAIKYCPEQADELQKRIALYEKRRDTVIERRAYSVGRLIPDKEAQDYKIQVLLEQARRLVTLKDYSGALVKYNEILLLDPYNADATQGKRGVGRRISLFANERYINTHRRTVSEIEWKYAIPIIPEASGSTVNTVSEQPKLKNAELKKSPLRTKLDEIQIPSYNFTGQSLAAVLRSLQEMSRINDLKGKRGINIVYIPDARSPDETLEEQKQREEARAKRLEERKKKKEERRKAAGEGNDNAGGGAANDNSDEDEDEENVDDIKVKLSGEKTSLFDVLTKLCNNCGLNMQVEDFAVIVTPKNITLSEMELMTFPVTIPPDEAGKDPKEISAKIKDDLVTKAGPNIFPKGSSIFYNPTTKRLSILNTVDNLRILQGVIEQVYPAKSGTMVQVMIKMLDINQDDLDELAFNWQLAINAAMPRTYTDDGKTSVSSRGIMDINNPLLRYYTSAGDRQGGNVNGSLLSWVWENNKGTRVVASMFALDQASSADVLMSPRVTVKDGYVAVVNMFEDHNYPDKEWNNITVPVTNNATFYATAQPELDNEQQLGIPFTVKPTVKNNIIELEVNVKFKTLAGWSEIDTRIFDEEGNVEDGNLYRMPIINTPEIKTKLHIRDGETVIAGGIVSDETSSINDKIPILGDIPFIGRFFQSKGTTATKRNLLVFVTCRLVKPDGTPLNPDPRQQREGTFSKGLPRFHSTL